MLLRYLTNSANVCRTDTFMTNKYINCDYLVVERFCHMSNLSHIGEIIFYVYCENKRDGKTRMEKSKAFWKF
jgi:hypothetical protein